MFSRHSYLHLRLTPHFPSQVSHSSWSILSFLAGVILLLLEFGLEVQCHSLAVFSWSHISDCIVPTRIMFCIVLWLYNPHKSPANISPHFSASMSSLTYMPILWHKNRCLLLKQTKCGDIMSIVYWCWHTALFWWSLNNLSLWNLLPQPKQQNLERSASGVMIQVLWNNRAWTMTTHQGV